MEIHIADQLRAIVYAVAVGAFLAAVYDVVRITRILAGLRFFPYRLDDKTFPLIGTPMKTARPSGIAGDIFVFVGDILFFLFAAFTYTVFLFHANDGNSRLFLTVPALGGFLLWFLTVGRLTVRSFGAIRFFICLAFAYLRFFLLLPVRLTAKYAVRPLFGVISRKKSENRTKKAQKGLAKSLEIV